MSEEEKKPARPIGSAVERYRKLGQSKQQESEKASEQDTSQSNKPESLITDNPVLSPSTTSESQISSNSDTDSVEYPERQKSGISDSQKLDTSDNQKVEGNKIVISYTREKKPERKAQIVYLPPDVKDHLKLYAVKHKREISEIVTDLVVAFLEKEENK
jgi:hypothetical protein